MWEGEIRILCKLSGPRFASKVELWRPIIDTLKHYPIDNYLSSWYW